MKVCSHNCVYCQLGRTRTLTATRRAYYGPEAIAEEVRSKLRSQRSHPDYVTFIGHGEPTLASNLGRISQRVSDAWAGKLALLTNGSMFRLASVREDCMGFDVVAPTVSAGNEALYRRMHRPHAAISLAKVVEGLSAFACDYPGEMWAEVMLVSGLNDTKSSLEEIRVILDRLDPARIHLTAPVRPPAEGWVRCPTREGVELALSVLPGSVDLTAPEPESFPKSLEDPVERLMDVVAMHPLRESQLLGILIADGRTEAEALRVLEMLVSSGRLSQRTHRGTKFYIAKG